MGSAVGSDGRTPRTGKAARARNTDEKEGFSLRRLSIGIAFAMLMALLALPASAGTADTASRVSGDPLTKRVTGTTDEGGTFKGWLTVKRFADKGERILAIGSLTGRLFDENGDRIGRVQDVRTRIPVGEITGTCEILHLVLGPLDLNLLGLRVQLNRVVLDITAEQGPGNLLGNLLCAIANLLNPRAPASVLSTLLNYLVSILR